jgi:Icc-related predicted phosphoesterase
MSGDHEMITTGYSNITPWESPRELAESDMAERLEEMFTHVQNPESLVCVIHPPPYATELDQAPAIDKDFRLKTTGGVQQMASVGSTAVREFLEKHEPLLGLHGHVHESKAAQRIGRTLCVNPGSEYTEGVLCGVVVTLRAHEVASYQFVVG